MKVQETSDGAEPRVAALGRLEGETPTTVPARAAYGMSALGAGYGRLGVSSLLGLQRSAGNAAVVRLLHAPVQRQAVQRQEAGVKDEACEELIAEKDWQVKGMKLAGGYDTGNFYKDVARHIIETAGQRGVDFHRALFIVAQARAEQGPTNPEPRRFRILNVQVRDNERQGSQVFSGTGSKTIFINPAGRKWVWLCSPEEGDACTGQPRIAPGCEEREKDFPHMKPTACLRKSPFFVFDSMEESINHYLDEVTGERPSGRVNQQGEPIRERPDAGKILLKEGQQERAGILEFGHALKKIGYATAADYATSLCHEYNTVTQDMEQILDQAIATKRECLDDALKKVSPYWEKLNTAKRRYSEVKAEADTRRAKNTRVTAVYQDEVDAMNEVKRWEGLLKDLEALIPKLRADLEKLEGYRKALKPATCPAPAKAAAGPKPAP